MSHTFLRRGTRLEPQPAPWASKDGVGAMFLLRGDMQNLQQVCDRLLNQTKHLTYAPIDEFVMLTVQDIVGFRSLSVPSAEQVAYDYGEAAFWMPVREHTTGHEAFLLPYVLHGRSVPTSLGRELWGFAKECADVIFDDRVFAVGASVSALTWPGGGTAPTLDTLCEVRSALSPVPPTDTKQEQINLFDTGALDSFLGKSSISGAALRLLLGRQFDFLHLRQLPSPVSATPDCELQQVVRMPVTLVSPLLSAVPLLVPHHVHLPPRHSHPIADDFGFTLDAQDEITASIAVRAKFAFELGQASQVIP